MPSIISSVTVPHDGSAVYKFNKLLPDGSVIMGIGKEDGSAKLFIKHNAEMKQMTSRNFLVVRCDSPFTVERGKERLDYIGSVTGMITNMAFDIVETTYHIFEVKTY